MLPLDGMNEHIPRLISLVLKGAAISTFQAPALVREARPASRTFLKRHLHTSKFTCCKNMFGSRYVSVVDNPEILANLGIEQFAK